MGLVTQTRKAWNAFWDKNPTNSSLYYGGDYRNPSQYYSYSGSSKSIVSTINSKIAVDVSMKNLRHVRLNEDGKYEETIDDGLNRALNYSANIDQTGREFIKDCVYSLLDEGVLALVPYETDVNPLTTDSYEVLGLRRGKILEWFPDEIRVEVYNEITGKKEELVLPKRICAIVTNPFYEIMNEPNSTVKRLIRVLGQLDKTNENSSAGKLDLIVQLPFLVKNQIKRMQAEERRKKIEQQLTGSQYGIAYIDGTEKVIQLNRSIENNIWEQARELTTDLFNQMGLTMGIFDGTADEQAMTNYFNRTIEPILSVLTEEMTRKFISKTAYAQRQRVWYFNDPFKLVPVTKLAEIVDKFIRGEIASPNDFRSVIGLAPSKDPKSDELRNTNLNQTEEKVVVKEEDEEIQNQ